MQYKIGFNKEEAKIFFHPIDVYLHDVDGKLDWKNISPLMPSNIEKKIKNKYNQLTDNEIKACCLLIFDVAFADIAKILSFRQKSICVVISKIKKKTGMKEFKKIYLNFVLTDDSY